MSDIKLHIVIAETAPIISTGLAHIMTRLPGISARVTEMKSPADLPDCLRNDQPDILIVNPSFGGVFNPDEIRTEIPEIKIIAVETGPLDKNARQLFDDVISVIDDIETITTKIRDIAHADDENADGKEPLSQREKEVIALVVKGMTNKEIADSLFLSVHTVITHRRNIARKLEIHSATGLTIYAIVNKLVDISDIHLS